MPRIPRLTIAGLVLVAASCSGPESPGDKSEWSALQGAEYDYRNSTSQEPIVLQLLGYRLAGFPNTDGKGLVWVLLNPRHEPLYKQLPNGSDSLTSSQLSALHVQEPAVFAQLQAHVRK